MFKLLILLFNGELKSIMPTLCDIAISNKVEGNDILTVKQIKALIGAVKNQNIYKALTYASIAIMCGVMFATTRNPLFLRNLNIFYKVIVSILAITFVCITSYISCMYFIVEALDMTDDLKDRLIRVNTRD